MSTTKIVSMYLQQKCSSKFTPRLGKVVWSLSKRSYGLKGHGRN